jgi:hypothetical protein
VHSNRQGGAHPRGLRWRPINALVASGVMLLAGLHTAFGFRDSTAAGPQLPAQAVAVAGPSEPISHLVISEVMTGGASASDEFIEIYNPAATALPLEGLEIVYVTASGGTITRKASWPAGSAPLAAGAHVLVANSSGAFATVADQTFTGGLAATGGSVAIRIQGATTAVDAAGWGNAASTWLEGTPAPAVSSGHSIERLPGGSAGSGQDTEQNSSDFVDRITPDPQNSLAAPIPVATPAATPTQQASSTPDVTPTATVGTTPTVAPTATPAPTATVQPTATPTSTMGVTSSPTASPSAPASLSIAEARAMADRTTVTIDGFALTDSAFADGGGYLTDATAGIAVLVSDGSFSRGGLLRITGELDDRFSQRTLRTDASSMQALGGGSEPASQARQTGQIGEQDEGELVEITGLVASSATTLTSGIAFDLDDGSGPIRVLVGTATGIDTGAWQRGTTIHLRGVVGQRDSSGTGTLGYRLQPRDPTDILAVAAPTPTPSASATPGSSASPIPNPAAITIAAARARPFNSRITVRGVVTLPSDLVEQGTAAIQDSTGAIILRLSDEAGSLRLGELIEVAGTRSTKSGMETVRVVAPPRRLGTQASPDPRRGNTGGLGEPDEALLVRIHGPITATPRRSSADNVYFDVDDGSGPMRVFAVPGASVETENLLSGTIVDIVGVLGQETTGRQPERGYRLWPRRAQDLGVVSQPTGLPGGTDGGSGGATGGSGGPRGHDGSTSGNGAAGHGGATSAPVAQQHLPRLHAPLAATTPSVRPVRRVARGADAKRDDEPSDPKPLAAGLLLVGALALLGAGIATGDPGLPRRLLAIARGALRRDEGDADVPGTTGAADEEARVGLPRLVPLTVVHEERGRILPPT